MIVDKRELILGRLRQLIETVPGTVRWGRNREEVSGGERPAINVNDGSEEAVDEGDVGGSRNSQVQRMRMEPEFVILVGAATEQVGTEANLYRQRLIDVLWSDFEGGELKTLLGPNGRIRYTGGGFTAAAGQTREGRMEVNIALIYVFKREDLRST